MTLAATAACGLANAQQNSFLNEAEWSVGVGTGFHYSSMSFSDLSTKQYPTNEGVTKPQWSIFVQGEFGPERNLVARPQLTFVTRGGKLTEIGSNTLNYEANDIDDIFYKLNAHYVDFRLPLLYQFGKAESRIRLYAGLTPILAFATSGDICLQQNNTDFSHDGYHADLNSTNFSSAYLAVAPTVGVRFNIPFGSRGQHTMFVNLEANYELGLSDTYGSDKDGKGKNITGGGSYKFDGTRKFNGFGMQVMVGIPFSAFKRQEPQPVVEAPVIPQPIPQPVVVKEEKPCYTLEEIIGMMDEGKSVLGKTICAVDAITFEFGKSNIKPESYSYLNRVAETIKRTGSQVKVKGHTDNVGTDEFNMKLSKARAQAVVKYLTKHGVDKDRLSYEYYGASRPLKNNDTDEGRTYNRRVEFEIIK